MNYGSLALATLGATVAYFAYGGLAFGLFPQMQDEFRKFPNVYRDKESMMRIMPFGMAGILISILVVATLYAKIYRGGGSGWQQGAMLGVLIGIFVVGMFVIHNHVNLSISLRLTVQQGIAYFIQWVLVGLVIGAIYRLPAPLV